MSCDGRGYGGEGSVVMEVMVGVVRVWLGLLNDNGCGYGGEGCGYGGEKSGYGGEGCGYGGEGCG